jgi:tRNA (guanine37-N1)-methyltransferase
MLTYHLITLFPESTDSYLNASILKRAQEKGLIALKYYNPRDFTASAKKGAAQTYAERRVDDRPYGGGPGMVIEALPVIKAIEQALKVAKKPKAKIKIIFFSPAGKQFSNELADTFKKYTDIIFVCGRYEGIDARVKKAFPMVDISVGPYVLTGGELPAMIMIDTITRRIPGVLGDNLSIEEERIASPDVYTRPEIIEYKKKKYRVPKVLLSGHHAKMDEWKKAQKNVGKNSKK